MPIETRGVLAYRDRDSGALVVSSSTQSPYTLRDVVAAALGLPVEDVRVVVPDVGGGFGPKGADLSRGDPGRPPRRSGSDGR